MPLNHGASTPKTPLVSRLNAGYACHVLTAVQGFFVQFSPMSGGIFVDMGVHDVSFSMPSVYSNG